MKAIIRHTALFGGLILATATFAQTKAAPAQSVTKVSSATEVQKPQGSYMFSADHMTQELGLSDDQSQKMHSIEADVNKRTMELEKLDPKERNEKEQALMAEYNKMVSSVLTKEQNEKLRKMQAEKLEERKGKMEQAVPKETK